ncbi:hypothetical protein LTR37_007590 [Vermiconidia calcicola]|uniref:Uncharacterized protein n=1 Tax=Vermiconidia calcicola TaxID=1690605 RepID=A0ACC3NES5_9PEZI|nr:hypothetical protein LTR37_007590 [Vermiconidia calcicola]
MTRKPPSKVQEIGEGEGDRGSRGFRGDSGIVGGRGGYRAFQLRLGIAVRAAKPSH